MYRDCQLKKCVQCGAEIPVSSGQSIVSCRFCGSEYDVVRMHGQTVHGQELPNASGLLIGGITGLILGALIFTPIGRSLAKATVKRATTYVAGR